MRRPVARGPWALALCAAALGGVACGGGSATVPGAVLLTVSWSPDATPTLVTAARALLIEVDGEATPYQHTFSEEQVAALVRGPATVRYRPGIASGSLTFRATVRDAASQLLAAGSVGVTVDPAREVAATLLLDLPASPPDLGGVDRGPAADLTVADLLVPPDGGPPDLSAPDLTMPDLALPPDLRPLDFTVPDLAPPPDLTVPDLVPPPDLVVPPDLLPPPPDLAGPVVASHTKLGFLGNAGDLVAAVATIDTGIMNNTPRLLDGNGQPLALPVGADFTYEVATKSAVLRVGAWTVASAVTVKGPHPLIVLAAGAVTISARVSAAATLDSAGPGGYAASNGTGAGTDGTTVQGHIDRSGGGGAGFRDAGGKGGATTNVAAAGGGGSYGALLGSWDPGSGGGNSGSAGNCTNAMGGPGGTGGAGGGGLQITSAVRLTVDANGSVDAGGGGGLGGCTYLFNNNGRATGGGGGGSGGLILLEAPVIALAGGIYANGGGGGGAGDLMNSKSGTNGQDGQRSNVAAAAGTSSGNGGAGGTGGTSATPGSAPMAVNASGGGGGAAGRIFFHARLSPTLSGLVSPDPAISTDL